MLRNKIYDGLTYLSDPAQQEFADDIYIKVRKTEGRLYSDNEVRYLPDVPPGHPLKKEWEVRKKTAENLAKYFTNYNNNEILEVGCGNGWLSNFLAEKTKNNITALDLNESELKQAVKVFSEKDNLRFIFGNIFENIFPQKKFNFILLAGSIQYFRDFKKLIEQLSYYLKPGGEIHIADSPFYKEEEKEAAKKRTGTYYNSIGFPEMIKNYYHRSWDELGNRNYYIVNWTKVRYSKILTGLKIPVKNIFPWIIIKNP